MAAFAILGIPQQIKTDNGPAYTSQRLCSFLTLWGISHTTGIPHSSTEQAIIECAYSTLKCLLAQQKGGRQGCMPMEQLHKALCVFNLLNCYADSKAPPIIKHFSTSKEMLLDLGQKARVLVKTQKVEHHRPISPHYMENGLCLCFHRYWSSVGSSQEHQALHRTTS